MVARIRHNWEAAGCQQPCELELWLLPLFRPWLWCTTRSDWNLAVLQGDSGTRFSLTYSDNSAGPSAAPTGAAGAAPGASGAASPPNAAPAAAADGAQGAWAAGKAWLAINFNKMCTPRSVSSTHSLGVKIPDGRSYSSPGRIRQRNTDFERHEHR